MKVWNFVTIFHYLFNRWETENTVKKKEVTTFVSAYSPNMNTDSINMQLFSKSCDFAILRVISECIH